MKKVIMSIAWVSSLMFTLASCAEQPKQDATQEKISAEEPSPIVKVESVHSEDVPQIGEFTATVEANMRNNIVPQQMLRIKKIMVEVGDQVKKGQILAQLDDSNLKQALIQLENAEREFKRTDELYKIGGLSESAWESQKSQIDVSRTMIENLKENTRLRSPMDGIVTARNYDSGDMTGQNPIYTVEQIRPVKLKINISESYYTQIKKGQEVDVRFDVYGDESFKGKIHLVYPTIDPQTRTFTVEIRIDNRDLRIRPGMFSRVTITFRTEQHVVIPDQAIIKQAGSGDRYIYTYKDGVVKYKLVQLGRRLDDRYEVISGVSDGEQVVIAGHSRLNDGVKVVVK